MANELAAVYLTGATLKAQMAQAAAVINADIAMTEVGSSGYYTGTVPASSAGLYNVYITAAGIPVGVGTLNWDGSAEIKLPTVPASATNITGGTITTVTTVTNLTNAPTNGDLTATMKTSVTTAATAATPTAAAVTGAVGSVTGAVGYVTGNVGGNVTGSVGSVVGAVGSVTGLTAADVAAIKAKTDSLAFTSAGIVDANVQMINDVTITGNGQVGTEFGV
jgi:hypothetical protein